jgi:hypothetical protein
MNNIRDSMLTIQYVSSEKWQVKSDRENLENMFTAERISQI